MTGRIYDRLVAHFGKTSIFRDIDDIPPGIDFPDYLKQTLEHCQVMIVVIGKTWLHTEDNCGNRRLENSSDWVRLEVKQGLSKGKDFLVVPLLVRRATMPKTDELPEDIKGLAKRNYAHVKPDPDFHSDMSRLIKSLENYFREKDLSSDYAKPRQAIEEIHVNHRISSISSAILSTSRLFLVGLAAVSVPLAGFLLLTFDSRSTSTNNSVQDRPTPPTETPTSDLVESALASLALGNLSTTRALIDQLLDKGDFSSAESVLETVSRSDYFSPDITFSRGRFFWQQMATGQSNISLNDARRAWTLVVEGQPDDLNAWIALGFAHYALGDYGKAIQSWERAMVIDQSQIRDADPSRLQVKNPITIHAYAGLAMAYRHESAGTLLPEEQLPFEQQAQAYLRQALALDPTLIDPNKLEVTWLWTPSLISDWQSTVAQLSGVN